MCRWDKTVEGLIVSAALLLAAVAARPYAGSWNDGSRLATVESLVDHHTWVIDRSIFVRVPDSGAPLPYPANDPALLEHGTQDKLCIDGHYYSDKSPVPAVLMASCYRLWQWATGMTARTHPDRFCWIMAFVFSGLAYTAAVWCIYRLARRLGLPLSSRLLLTASFALATVALPYSRQVNNHILLLTVAAALTLQIAALHGEMQHGIASWRRFAVLGFLAGFGYTIDLGAGPVILLCTFVTIFRFARIDKSLQCARLRIAAKRTIIFVAAALPWLVLHHALNYAIGGSFKPANANPEYFRWPGSPFAAGNLTGSWIHLHIGSFLLYAASMLAGKRGFFGHNLPLFLTIPALFFLLRRHREIRREVLWALGCCAGTWLLYAATSNNSSGQCCTIRWFVPLLAPAYFVIALLLRHDPRYRVDLLLLSAWGALLVVLMRKGPWMGGMVPLFWPIQAAALGTCGLYHYLRSRHPVSVVATPAANTSSYTNSATRTSMTFVWVSPVFRRSPVASKKE